MLLWVERETYAYRILNSVHSGVAYNLGQNGKRRLLCCIDTIMERTCLQHPKRVLKAE